MEDKQQQTQSTESTPNPNSKQDEIIKVMEVVERDSSAIAESYKSLFSSLRVALSEATTSSVDHMSCFNDASGRLQESGTNLFKTSVIEAALEAATRGNRYINSCLRLHDEMKDVVEMAIQLKTLRRTIDALDSAVNKLIRLP